MTPPANVAFKIISISNLLWTIYEIRQADMTEVVIDNRVFIEALYY